MKNKIHLFIIVSCIALGSFLTVFAVVGDVFAGANMVMSENIAFDNVDESFINEISNEGGVPFIEISGESSLDVSEETSSEASSKEESSKVIVSSAFESSSSKISSSEPVTSSVVSRKPRPEDAPEYSTPSSKPQSSSKPVVSSKEESSSKPESSQVSSESSSKPPVSSVPSDDLKVKVKVSGVITEMSAYEAVSQIVEGEMGSSFSVEALKAQAVAVYTYVKYQNKSGGAPSLPMRTASEKVKNAVFNVLGQAIYYNGNIAFTPYHATSSGYTNSSAEVWGGSYSYLTNVESIYDPTDSYKNRETIISLDTMKSSLEKYLGVTMDDTSPENWIKIDSKNSGGYVLKVTVTDADGKVHTLTGRNIRENVLNYALKSHAFTVSYQNGNFKFVTNGYGHGVGMSQTGANGYAINKGWTYKQILSHYYPNTSVY